MKKADMQLTIAGQQQGLEVLQAENAQLRTALQRFVTAAKSWHEFHHGSSTVQCDWLCECIAPGERALAGIPEPSEIDGPGEEDGPWAEGWAERTAPPRT